MNSKLEAIASLVTTESVIDVGCDHGYLDIFTIPPCNLLTYDYEMDVLIFLKL